MKKEEEEEEEEQSKVLLPSPPSWWQPMESKIFALTNPAIFADALNATATRERCAEHIEKDVKRKLAAEFDVAKEAAEMLPAIHKRLRESQDMRNRVQSELATRCAWEKVRPFEKSEATLRPQGGAEKK